MKVKTRRILLIAGGLWLILLAHFYPDLREAMREQRSMEQAFDHYSEAIVQRRYDEAYSHCGSEIRHVMDHEHFVASYRSLEQQYGPLKSYNRSSYYVRGEGSPPINWTGAIVARFLYEKKIIKFDFVPHKEQDRWVLFDVNQE
jgi:hypothetical protein